MNPAHESLMETIVTRMHRLGYTKLQIMEVLDLKPSDVTRYLERVLLKTNKKSRSDEE
jgi:DNA-binding CsgD family transcriptional regulator